MIILRTLLPTLALCASFAADYTIDPAHSNASFTVRHMMVTNVRGQFSNVTGKINYDAKNPAASKVSASIDATTVNTQQQKRDAHLRSADFFDVEKYPKMTFESTRWFKEGDQWKMAGNLTMHGVTKLVIFEFTGPINEVKEPNGGMRAGATVSTRISRKEWGLTWNRAVEAGGVAVSDEVEITLDIEAVSKPAGS
jgi:polyisoprenoid-binding protein YceI